MNKALDIAALLIIYSRIFPIVSAQQIYNIPRTGGVPPLIDGNLNESIWKHTAIFKDFKTMNPLPGESPSERTTVHITYDQENIYIGFYCYDSQPDQIRDTNASMDNPANDDWISFCLDSYNDELGAFFFLVNPRGVQTDGILDAHGSPNMIYNMQWSGAARRAADGWTAEMAIPFRNLAFTWKEKVVMGFKVARFISRNLEEVDFPEILPQRAPHLTQFAKIEFSLVDKGLMHDEAIATIVREMHRQKMRLGLQFDSLTFDDQLRAWDYDSPFDYLVFPSHPLKAGSIPYHFAIHLQEQKVKSIFESMEYWTGKKIDNLERFLSRTFTAAFIVIKNDTIIYERYFDDFGPDSIVTSFSMAKSFTSTLIGIAIDEGLIGSVMDPITKYLPELRQRDERFTSITIKDLLMMSAGIRYDRDSPVNDDDTTYHSIELRKNTLENTTIIDPPGRYFLYNDYHPPLLGMILERVTGKSVTEYLQENLWSPLGMEYAGSWSIDSKKGNFEKMLVGINARPIDFAKLGRLFLNNGCWNGKQIVSESWVEHATQPEEKPDSYYQDDPWFNSLGHYYKYFWWGDKRPGGKSDFHAAGNLGQYIYVSPQKKIIIIRNGIDFGIPFRMWPRLFYEFVSRL